jgi:hypothetical protein
VCGNGVKEKKNSEDFDGTDFGEHTCAAAPGLAGCSSPSGMLICTPDCTIDFSQCHCGPTTTLPGGGTTSSTTPGASSTTTTTISGGTTTTTTPGATPAFVDFTTAAGGGTCGRTFDNVAGTGTPLRQLSCGGLNIGGGASTVPENITPDGATSRFAITGCTGNSCTLGPTATATQAFDCTTTGCAFGPPLPISNAGTSSCVINRFSGPAGGTLDIGTGATTNLDIALGSNVFLTGNADQPCPVCASGGTAVSGTPANPATGTCSRGANAGDSCRSTNSDGLSKDCPPGGASAQAPCTPGAPCTDGSQNLGVIPVDLAPLTTGTRMVTAADGLFCSSAGQASGQRGCFANGASCKRIEVEGDPAGSLLPIGTASSVTLASTFCIPSTSSPLVNFAANLPGPGATALRGTLKLGS